MFYELDILKLSDETVASPTSRNGKVLMRYSRCFLKGNNVCSFNVSREFLEKFSCVVVYNIKFKLLLKNYAKLFNLSYEKTFLRRSFLA